MANQSQIVDVEEKHINPSPDSPDDEYITPASMSDEKENSSVDSIDEKEPGDQEVEGDKTPTAEEAKPDKVTPVAEVKPKVSEDVSLLAESLQNLSQEYKRLDGESLREYALRLEVINTRRKLNSQKANELLGEEKPKTPVVRDNAQEEDDVDPVEVERFKKIADKAGFIPKSEVEAQTYQEKAKGAFDDWISKNKEFSQENDPDGALWNLLKENFQSGRYNTRPPNPEKNLPKILDEIKRDMLGIRPTSELNKVKAQQENIKVASHVGATPGSGSSAPENKSKTAKKALLARGLKGFSDEEIDELSEDEQE